MYALRFTETQLYAQVNGTTTQLVNKGSATHYPTKQAATDALKNAGEFFEVVKLTKDKR